MGPGEYSRVWVGIAGTNNNRPGGSHSFAIFLGGLDVWHINDRFLPAGGFKHHGSSGVDGPNPETEFGFEEGARFHPEFPL